MGIYAIIDSGKVKNLIVADSWPNGVDVTNTSPRPSIGWLYDGTNFAAPEEPTHPNKITRLAFWQRFTSTERVTIDLASIDNPAADMPTRQQQASLRDLRTQVDSATFIDLNRTDTRNGVQLLETMGLLGVGRAAVILDTTPTDMERPPL